MTTVKSWFPLGELAVSSTAYGKTVLSMHFLKTVINDDDSTKQTDEWIIVNRRSLLPWYVELTPKHGVLKSYYSSFFNSTVDLPTGKLRIVPSFFTRSPVVEIQVIRRRNHGLAAARTLWRKALVDEIPYLSTLVMANL